jgi:hypothetical protein
MYQQTTETGESEFTHVTNKARLWKILQTNGAFNGINNNFFTKVREDFEVTIERTEEENKNKETMQKCKIFIDNMVDKMKQYKYQPSELTTPQSNNGTTPIFPERELPHTADDIRKSRLDAFDNDLNKKQSEFNQFNSKPTPPHVDFADKDNDSSGDVNTLLEKAMREREQLNLPTPPTIQQENIKDNQPSKKASPNINSSSDTSVNSAMTLSNDKVLVKILEKLEKIEAMLTEEREKRN